MTNQNTPYYSDGFYVGDRPSISLEPSDYQKIGKRHSLCSDIGDSAIYVLNVLFLTAVRKVL